MRDVLNIINRMVILTENKEIKKSLLTELVNLKIDDKGVQSQQTKLVE